MYVFILSIIRGDYVPISGLQTITAVVYSIIHIVVAIFYFRSGYKIIQQIKGFSDIGGDRRRMILSVLEQSFQSKS